MRWDSLSIILSDSAGPRVMLSGWYVEAGPQRFRLELPYGVAIGDRVQDVVGRVPEATGSPAGEEFTGEANSYVVTTPRKRGLAWGSPNPDGTGRVAEVVFNGEGCD